MMDVSVVNLIFHTSTGKVNSILMTVYKRRFPYMLLQKILPKNIQMIEEENVFNKEN